MIGRLNVAWRRIYVESDVCFPSTQTIQTLLPHTISSQKYPAKTSDVSSRRQQSGHSNMLRACIFSAYKTRINEHFLIFENGFLAISLYLSIANSSLS